MAIELKNITKIYKTFDQKDFYALDSINLKFADTGFYSIIGESGSGKSTLLNIIGKIEKETSGSILYSDEKIDFFHKDYVSFVFQDNNLIEDFSLIQNLKIVSKKDPNNLLKKVQLFEKRNVPVNKLSGGEKQRLALVRAILKDCKVIILDEPTLNLDKKNSNIIIDILKEISSSKLVIISTHDDEVIKYSDYLIKIKSGKIIEKIDLKNTTFELKNYNEKEILYIYNLIKSKKKYHKCILKINEKEIDVYNENTLRSIIFNLQENSNKITLKFQEHISKDNNLDEKENKNKKFKFSLMYSLLMIKKNIISTIFIILTLLISFGLTILMFNLTFNNSSDIINRSRNSYTYSLYPILKERYLNIKNKRVEELNGLHHYNSITKFVSKDDVLLSLPIKVKNNPKIEINNKNNYYLVLFNKNNYKNILNTIKYNKESIYITDYINDIYFKEEKNKNLNIIINDNLEINLNNINKNILKTKYKNLGFNPFIDDVNIEKNILKFDYKIKLVYMSEEKFEESLKEKTLEVPSSDFTIKSVFSILESQLLYKKYNNQAISYGNKIKNKNEIIVSKKFLEEKNLNEEDVIDKEYLIKNFDSLISKDEFNLYFNLGKYSKNFIIKGITNDNSSDIFINEDIFNEILKDYKYFISSNISLGVNKNFRNNLVLLHNEKFKIHKMFEEVYSVIDTNDTLLKKITITLAISLFIIAFSLIISNSILTINLKRKEIAILKSIGRTNKEIFKVFLYNNLIYNIISILIGFILSYMIYEIMNYLLINYIFKINYRILLSYWYTYFIVIFIYILFSIIVAYLPLLKINKIDIAEIKEF